MNRFLSVGIVLSALLLARVLMSDPDQNRALDKYAQAVVRVVENYVDEPDLERLYRGSITGLVKALDDSTLSYKHTALDTSVTPSLRNLSELRERFAEAWKFALAMKPGMEPDKMSEEAIKGMLLSLDPHSVYINPQNSARVMEDFEGRFSGIGLSYEIVRDTATVIYVIPDGPADKAGLFPGDKLLAIDTSDIVAVGVEQIRSLMRGPQGSLVRMARLTFGAAQTDTVKVIRASVPLYSIDASFMLDDETGFVRLNRFSATTHSEFVEAVESLKKQGMKRLIFDLRNNGGGYLSQALLLIDEFVDGKQMVLNTKSRHRQYNATYQSSNKGRLHDVPLMILVNQSSASASEVVSGALQDYDRALIVGKRTFGKGLVQQQYLLNDRSIVRVTTSRYYTPSGRLIQKPYVDGREAYAGELSGRDNDAETDVRHFVEGIPDSLVFRTTSGRMVYGGGGIVPDHILADTLPSKIIPYLRSRQVHYPLLFAWLAENGKGLVKMDGQKESAGFFAQSPFSDDFATKAEKYLRSHGVVASDTLTVDTRIKGDSLLVKPGLLKNDLPVILSFMKADLARMLWGTSGYWQAAAEFDQIILQSAGLWPEYDRLAVRE